jgi:hypothetical protein
LNRPDRSALFRRFPPYVGRYIVAADVQAKRGPQGIGSKTKPISKHDQRGVTRPQGARGDIGAVERIGNEEL